MQIKNHLPNLVTLLNLLCGSVAVTLALSGNLIWSAWFIIFAALFDFLDGFLARVLNARSAIGAQLDSLADVISFGLAPSSIIYVLLRESISLPDSNAELTLLPFAAFIIVAAAAFRLARFNMGASHQHQFIGLPTPAAGLFVASIPLILMQYQNIPGITGCIQNEITLLCITIVIAVLMVSKLPMLSLKFENFKWQDNWARFIMIGTAPFIILFFQALGIPMIVLVYILLSLAVKL